MAVFIFGIHVGMNYTKCAWSQSSQNSPVVSSFWETVSGLKTTEAPTIAIFSLDMKLKSFGYEAERQIQESNTDNMLVFSDFVRQIFCDGPYVSIQFLTLLPFSDCIVEILKYRICRLCNKLRYIHIIFKRNINVFVSNKITGRRDIRIWRFLKVNQKQKCLLI